MDKFSAQGLNFRKKTLGERHAWNCYLRLEPHFVDHSTIFSKIEDYYKPVMTHILLGIHWPNLMGKPTSDADQLQFFLISSDSKH